MWGSALEPRPPSVERVQGLTFVKNRTRGISTSNAKNVLTLNVIAPRTLHNQGVAQKARHNLGIAGYGLPHFSSGSSNAAQAACTDGAV